MRKKTGPQKKTWTQKMDGRLKPEVVRLKRQFAGLPAGTRLLVATPRLVKRFIEAIPPGREAAPSEMRAALASDHHADAACPVSTGIFLRIVCEAAWEEIEAGKAPEDVTPFWRAVTSESPVAKKLACGVSFVERMRDQEGLKTARSGGALRKGVGKGGSSERAV